MNKETLQSYNTRLSNNNNSLNDIVDIINELPECKETILQDKSITITENGTQSITFDDGYDGLNSVEVTTNIESSGGKYAPRYVYGDLFRNYDGTELDYEISNIDTSNITVFRNFFSDCQKLTSLDLSNWNTSNVTSMSAMFKSCYVLQTLNISSFKTDNVTNMSQMFYDCRWLKEIDLTSFNTENVIYMSSMFKGAYNLTELDLSNFKIPNVKNMGSMFDGCSKLTFLDIRNFTFDNVTTYNAMFLYIPADCLIIVKGDTEKQWVLTARSDLTNVKTVAEL